MSILTTTLILTILGYGGSGTAVFPLLKIGQGPRAAAMGESFTGLADDATAVYWNPSGLSQLSRCEIAISHQEWFADIKDELVHAALPLGHGVLGLGLLYAGEPDVRYWDDQTQSFETFLAWSSMLSVGYGLPLSDKYRIGATLTGLYADNKIESGAGGTISVGAMGEPIPNLGIGIAARHLGAMSYAGVTEKLPMEVGVGASYKFGLFKMTLDGVFALLDNTPNVRYGVEYTPFKPLSLRLGYRTGPFDPNSLGYINGLTGGIGLSLSGFTLDYAFVPYGELGLTHRIGLKVVLAPPTPRLKLGGQTVLVLDAETRARLAARLVFSGVAETTTVSEARLVGLKPGMLNAQATLDGYEPQTVSYRVEAGRQREDTIFLNKVPIASLAVSFYDAQTKQPITGMLTYRGPSSGSLPVVAEPGASVVTNIAPGTYALDAAGTDPAYLPQSCTLEIKVGEKAKRDFYLWKKTAPLVLEGINFRTGKADIMSRFYPILDRAGQILKQTPTVKKVELAGHTDPRPIHTRRFPSNWELSQARAEVVMRYLIEKWGIAPARLIAKGYADTQPIVPNTSPGNMYKNRRTELRIIEQ
jgi:outer membrane protein OmpA-like peptidoglycan-associated protein